MINKQFWQGKRVFITGHTGFKGSWLTLWLSQLGAQISGYALQPPTHPSLFELCRIDTLMHSEIGDIRDGAKLLQTMQTVQPEIVIHMAAQPLVRDSYEIPADTYAINVMGTVNLLEAVRKCPGIKAVINVTTDKCYENKEWHWGYRENEPMGGYDPYSNSKACSELVTASYRSSFFNPKEYETHGVAIATARAGNVIGGGDRAKDRLIPDCIRSLQQNRPILIRNPQAIRPWQHVLEPLSGYLTLAQKLYEHGAEYAEAWNFGPDDNDAKPVGWIVHKMSELWSGQATVEIDATKQPHEAAYLKLDCSKAKTRLQWQPQWTLAETLDKINAWEKAAQKQQDMRLECYQQIKDYMDGR